MPNFDEYMDMYLGQTAIGKAVDLEKARKQKEASMPAIPDADAMYRAAVASDRGIDGAIDDAQSLDVINLTGNQLREKYGQERANQLERAYMMGQGGYRNDMATTRDWDQTAADTVSGFAGGAVNGVASIGAFGVGLINDQAGAWSQEKLQSGMDWLHSTQSPALARHRAAGAVGSQLSSEANRKKYEAEGPGFFSGARRIGRDIIDSVANAAFDPTTLADGIAEGSGSLVAGGIASKGVRLAGSLALKGLEAGGVIGARTAAAIGTKMAPLAPNVAVGLQEAGGVHQQTVTEVMGMTHDQLMATSEDYREYIEEGMDPMEAKRHVANRAGVTAAMIQAPIAALVSKVTNTGHIVDAPLAAKGFMDGLKNIGKETLEEGLQGGTGQMATNAGIRVYADNNRDVSEGVGEQIGVGSLYGMGTAGAMQAPGLAGRGAVKGTVAVAKGVARTASGAVNMVIGRGERIRAANAELSPVSDTNMGGAVERMVAAAPEIEETIKAAIPETAKPEERASVDDLLGRIKKAAAYDHTPVATNPAYSEIAPVLEQAPNKFEALKTVRDVAGDTKAPMSMRLQAGRLLMQMSEDNAQLFETDLPDVIQNLSDDTKGKKALVGYKDMIQTLGDNPRVIEAVQKAMALAATPEALSNPETAQTAGEIVAEQAARNPDKVTPEQIDLTLRHHDAGDFTLSDNQLKGMKAARGLAQAQMEAQARAKSMGNIKLVNRQVISADEEGLDEAKQSMAQHLKGIVSAVNAGNTDVAAQRLRGLAFFAEHMQNKVTALNTALATGKTNDRNTVKYRALLPSPDGGRKVFGESPKGVYVDATKRGSVELAQQISLEAGQLGSTANSLIDAYPDIAKLAGLKHITLSELDPSLAKDSWTVVDTYAAKPPVVPANETNSQQNGTDAKAKPSAKVNTPKAPSKKADPRQGELDLQAPAPKEKIISKEEAGKLTDEKLADLAEEHYDTGNETSEAILAVVTTEQDRREDAAKAANEDDAVTTQRELNAEKAARRAKEEADAEAAEAAAAQEAIETEKALREEEAALAIEEAKTPEQKAFPDLLGSDDNADAKKGLVRNWFRRVFKVPGEGKSIAHYDGGDALAHVSEALSSSEALAAVSGKKSGHRLTPKLVSAYDDFLHQVGSRMDKALKENLATADPKLLEMLNNGIEANRLKKGLSLNLAEIGEDGKLRWNQELLNRSVLASLNWVLNSSSSGTHVDTDKFARSIGLPASLIQEWQMETMNNTLSTDEVRDRLAQLLPKYWGVQPDNTAYKSVVDGIANSMAAELMRAMKSAELIDFWSSNSGQKDENGDPVKADPDFRNDASETAIRVVFRKADGTAHRTFIRVNTENRPPVLKAMLARLASFPGAIELASIVEPEQATFVGAPPTNKDVPSTQQRSPIPLTRKERKAIIRANNTAHTVNRPLFNMVAAMKREGFLYLVGEGDLTNQKLNENHKASLVGRNIGISNAWDTAMNTWEEIQNKALDAEDKNPDNMPVFFKHGIIKTGRLQQIGKYVPQTNKELRELFLSTNATLDMSNDTHFRNYMLAQAQALGIKVNRDGRVSSEAQAQDLLSGKFAPVVDMLMEWQKTDQSAFTQKQLDLIKNTFVQKPTMVALHALMDYARYQNAVEAGDITTQRAFKTQMYLEADGVTNGPAMALMMYTHGGFNDIAHENLKRAGFFQGRREALTGEVDEQGNPLTRKTTYADYFQSEGAKDLYGHSGGLMESNLMESGFHENTDGPMGDILYALRRVTSGWLGDFTVAQDGKSVTLTVGRGLMKNPLTITVYGSGLNGIAGKIAREIIAQVYAAHSQILQGVNPEQQEMWDAAMDDLEFLMSHVLGQDGMESSKHQTHYDDNGSLTFTPGQIEMLTQNLEEHFVSAMGSAIHETMFQHSPTALNKIKQLVQIQSAYQKRAMDAEIQERMKWHVDNDPNWKQGDFLSEKELTDIQRKIKFVSPYVETGDQNLLMSGSEQKVTFDETGKSRKALQFGAALDESLAGPASFFGVGDSGVKGMPYMTIGPGDGQTILNMYNDNPDLERVTPIFDGVHMPLDKIDEYGEQINKAAADAALANPARAVADSFRAFLRDAAVMRGTMSKFETQQFLRTIFAGVPPEVAKPNTGNVQKALEWHLAQLDDMVIEIDARHEAIRKVGFTVDQMASAESPYVSGEVEPENWDDGAAVDELNKAYDEIMSKSPGRESESIDAVWNMATPNGNRARIVTPANLQGVIDKMAIPAAHKSLLRSTLSALGSKAPAIVIGNAQQLKEFAVRNEDGDFDASINGMYVAKSNTIYIRNASSETLVHELIHAATLQTVFNYYTNPKSVTVSTREAIKRLERLMAQWHEVRGSVPEKQLTHTARRAFDSMEAELARIDTEQVPGSPKQKAAALNEFMAWTLSNQTLAAAASRTTVTDKLARIAKQAYQWIRGLVFQNAAPAVGNDVLSNIRFNTEIILRDAQTRETIYGPMTEFNVYHRQANDMDPVSIAVSNALTKKVAGYMDKAVGVADIQERAEAVQKGGDIGNQIADALAAQGFNYNPSKQALLSNLVAAFATGLDFDTNMLNRLDQVYRHVTANLTAEMLSRDQSDQNANHKAELMLGAILGNNVVLKDAMGRSTLLPTFLALSMIDDDMKRALTQIKLPEASLPGYKSADDALTSIGNLGIDKLSRWLSKEGMKSKNAGEAITNMMGTMAAAMDKEASFLSMQAKRGGSYINKFNGWTVRNMQAVSGKVVDSVADKIGNSKSKLARGSMLGVLAVGSAVNQDIADKSVEDLMQAADRNDKIGWELRGLMNEVFGRNAFNAPIFDMIKQVKSVVEKGRETYRDRLPPKIAKAFTREITETERTHIFKGVGETDLAAMLSGRTELKDVLDMLGDDAKIDALVKDHEAAVKNLTHNWNKAIAKSKQLARYMSTKKTGHRLMRNAYAIAAFHEAGSSEQQIELVQAIDRLTTLYAMQALPKETKETLASLVKEQREGIEYVVAYLHRLREDEMNKVNEKVEYTDPNDEEGSVLVDSRARMNWYKGHIPSEAAENTSLVVEEDEGNYQRLTEMGYKRIADYNGSIHEVGKAARGYYFKAMSAKPMFNQGLVQTVRVTAGGVDPKTGYTFGRSTAGIISNPKLVARISAAYDRGDGDVENLMPIFDRHKRVVAYERSIDPDQEVRLDRSTDIFKMIGAWKGRQFEEKTSVAFNNEMVHRAYQMWEENRGTKQEKGFVNLLDEDFLKSEPVIADAVSLFPDTLRKEIQELYGKDGFMVPRSLVHDIVGQRSASIDDFWSGNTRWSKEAQESMKSFMTAAIGIDAYKYAVNAERYYQVFIHDAKKNIIIRSVIVPAANLASNFVQAMSRGISPVTLVRELPKKMASIEAYVQNHLEYVGLEADLEVALGRKDTLRANQIKTQMQTLEDAQRRMDIWPLIENGEFTSISEGLENEGGDWKSLTKGRITDYIESKVNQLPESVRSLGRYGYLTQDTALFRGLQKTVDYGDFVFKAIMYDHLINNEKMAKEKALAFITEEFVHYDRMSGRGRQYLESMGTMWFWRFKLRSVKTAAHMIRNNPVHALLANFMPIPMASGGPITDNFFGSLIQGNLWYSTGPWQALRGYAMNPWINLSGL